MPPITNPLGQALHRAFDIINTTNQLQVTLERLTDSQTGVCDCDIDDHDETIAETWNTVINELNAIKTNGANIGLIINTLIAQELSKDQ